MKSGATAAVLATLSLAACGRPDGLSRPERPPAVVAISELLRALPDSPGRQRVWALERQPELSASIVDPRGTRLGMGQNPRARTRLLILKGTVRVRAGLGERTLGPGSFVSVPRGMFRRISPAGEGQILYLRVLAPDMDRTISVEPRSRGGGR
ncbi:MAG: hypothetical protein HY077_07895 [Elusimicrobia bacterium]|nr:hypothetical protein [Elusimicrobiota bacterium]